MNEDETTSVYRCYGEESVLLYVGVSVCVEQRMRAHRTTAEWFGEVTRVEQTPCISREEAFLLERELIAKEGPIHNKSPGQKPTLHRPAKKTCALNMRMEPLIVNLLKKLAEKENRSLANMVERLILRAAGHNHE